MTENEDQRGGRRRGRRQYFFSHRRILWIAIGTITIMYWLQGLYYQHSNMMLSGDSHNGGSTTTNTITRNDLPSDVLFDSSMRQNPRISDATGRSEEIREVYHSSITNKPYLHRKKKKKNSAAICAMVKDETRYHLEWILYHLLAVQFDHMYLYDNSDSGSAMEWYQNMTQINNHYHDDDPYNMTSLLRHHVTVLPYPGYRKARQNRAYQKCVRRFGYNYTWIAFMDADEFLILKKHDTVVDFLQDHCTNGSVAIPWLVFGTANHTTMTTTTTTATYRNEPLTKRFQYHAGRNETRIKTIVKVSDYKGVTSPHWVQLKDPKQRTDTSGHLVQGMKQPGGYNPTFHPNGPRDVAEIYHYKYKSLEEYMIKACIRKFSFAKTPCRNYTLDDIPSGQYWDDTAYRILQQHVPYYRQDQ